MVDTTLLARVTEKAQSWLTSTFSNETKQAVQAMLDNPDKSALIDAFYQDLVFGTGGLRGVMGAGTNRMNMYTVGAATQGLANYLKKAFPNQTITVAIAHDNRNNSRFFSETAAQILTANGIYVLLFEDLRPTPEVSFAIRHFKCQSGIVMTASHNPKEYNGYKVYWNDGAQIIPPHDKGIIEEVQKVKVEDIQFSGNHDMIKPLGQEVDDLYLETGLSVSLSPEVIKQHHDIKIVYTPIHGTGVKLVPAALKKFGFTNVHTVSEQEVVSGEFPTVISPNPEEPAAMKMALDKGKEIDADVVMATDPDSDRVGVACKNEQGEFILINGNQTFLLFLYYIITRYKEQNKFTGNEFIVKTIVTTELATKMAKQNNIPCYDCYTGFKYIAGLIGELEGKKRYIGGGEESFGFLPGDYVRDKDAVISIALMAEITAWAKSKGFTLYQLLQQVYVEYGFSYEYMKYIVRKGIEGAQQIQQLMKNYRENPPKELGGERVLMIKDFKNLTIYDVTQNKTEPVTDKKGETSNVLQFFTEHYKVSVRPSGTEPKIKYYFEIAADIQSKEHIILAEKEADNVINNIMKELGV